MAANASHPKFLRFLPQDAVPGALLVLVAALAMVVVNSPWGPAYQAALSTPFSIGPTGGGIEMKLAYWIKNALMALFFFFDLVDELRSVGRRGPEGYQLSHAFLFVVLSAQIAAEPAHAAPASQGALIVELA